MTYWTSSICTRWRWPIGSRPSDRRPVAPRSPKALTERPDAILLDVLMPGDDGFATCARLKEHPVTRQIPVLLLTASDALDVEARAIRAGATLLLHKPCAAERLALTIDAAIAPPEQGGAR